MKKPKLDTSNSGRSPASPARMKWILGIVAGFAFQTQAGTDYTQWELKDFREAHVVALHQACPKKTLIGTKKIDCLGVVLSDATFEFTCKWIEGNKALTAPTETRNEDLLLMMTEADSELVNNAALAFNAIAQHKAVPSNLFLSYYMEHPKLLPFGLRTVSVVAFKALLDQLPSEVPVVIDSMKGSPKTFQLASLTGNAADTNLVRPANVGITLRYYLQNVTEIPGGTQTQTQSASQTYNFGEL